MSYILQESSEENYFIVTNEESGIVIKFKKKDFNNTQEITFLEDVKPDPLKIAKEMRKIGDFLVENHSDIM